MSPTVFLRVAVLIGLVGFHALASAQGAVHGAIKGLADAINSMAAQEIEKQRLLELERQKAAIWAEQERLSQQREAELRRRQAVDQAAARAAEERRLAVEARQLGSTGSGFFVSDRGHVLTNAHVIGDYSHVMVKDSTSQLFGARIVRIDRQHDLALLVVDRTSTGLPIAPTTENLKGEEVFAVGYPMPGIQGQESKITNGIVSSLSGPNGLERWMQISAPIQGGNSGGPLVTRHGEVVGIVVASINAKKILEDSGRLAQNVNYAIKSEQAIKFLSDVSLKHNRKPVEGRPLRAVDSSTVMIFARDPAFTVAHAPPPKSDNLKSPEEREEAEFRGAVLAQTTETWHRYLLDHPYGPHAKEARLAIASIDDAHWRAAAKSDTVAAYAMYLDAFASGKYSLRAQQRIVLMDAEAWRRAKGLNTARSYDAYLAAMPAGRYRDDAAQRIQSIDDRAWRAAQRDGSMAAINRYAAEFPSGKHLAEARALDDKLQRGTREPTASRTTAAASTDTSVEQTKPSLAAPPTQPPMPAVSVVGEVEEVFPELGYVVMVVTGQIAFDRPLRIVTSGNGEAKGRLAKTTANRASIVVESGIGNIAKGDRVVQ